MEIKARGIDVSYAQGVIDWPKVAQQVDFALIRATASYPGPGRSGVDTMWNRNIQEAREAGVPIGAYHYSYARDVAEIQEEARHFLATIRPYQFAWPVCLDYEEAFQIGAPGVSGFPLKKQMDMIEAWMKLVEDAGYFAMFYSTASAIARLRATYPERMAKYAVWVAHVDVDKPMTRGGIWQYSWKGKVDGIAGAVDLNFAYVDYPSIIKAAGKNGFGEPMTTPEKPPEEAEKPYQVFTLAGAFESAQAAQAFAVEQEKRTMILYERA